MNDDNIWIKTVNIRVESMPLSPDSSELSTGIGMEDLGKMHCNEYKANESNIPENDRKSVAISRLEGFFSIRDYIQTKGSREQKFHLDASIIGAVLFAALKEDDSYVELLKHKKIAEKIKSDLLSTLYAKISLAVEEGKELEEIKEIKGGNGLIKKKEFYVNGEIEKYDSIDSKSYIEGSLKSLLIPYDDPNFEREIWKIINTTGGIADNWNDLAYREYKITRNYEQGIEYGKTAIQLEKSNGKYYDTVGKGYLMIQEPEKAFEYFNIAVEIDKKNNNVNEDHIKNKKIALEIINEKEMTENLQSGVFVNPTFEAMKNNGRSSSLSKKKINTIEEYKQWNRERRASAVKAGKNRLNFQSKIGLLYAAKSAYDILDYEKAIELYNEVLKIDPSDQTAKERLKEVKLLYSNTRQGRREQKQQKETEIREKINYKLQNKIPLDEEEKKANSKIKAQRTKDFWLLIFLLICAIYFGIKSSN